MEILLKVGSLICLSVLSAVLYRAGGMGKEETAEPKWIPMFLRHSWIRDWLCPLLVYGSLCIFWLPLSVLGWLLLAVSYALLGGALTTYWDELFGFDNFWFSGFMCGVAAVPLCFCGFPFYIVLVRAIVLAVLWGAWCAIFNKDTTEEYGRGAFLVITVPLLLI